MQEVAKVTHYFSNIGVAVIKLADTLKVGDLVHFKGKTTDFEQEIESMQVNHENIEVAQKGDEVGLKVAEKVREGDAVLKKDA